MKVLTSIKEGKEKNVQIHKRRTNLPSVSEMAIVVKAEEYGNRHIIIEGR